jgi:hypothetical protein
MADDACYLQHFQICSNSNHAVDTTTRAVTTCCFHSVNRFAIFIPQKPPSTPTRECAMGILYNATLTPAMNDISVTSGNADGWVYAVAINVDPVALRAGEQAARRGTGGGMPAPAGKPAKGRKR